MPIAVLVELKDDSIPLLPTKPIPFDESLLDAVDAEIRAVFKPGDMLTPDDVRGAGKSLPDAIQKQGWPTLDSARGKVMFLLDNEGALAQLYIEKHPALKGRAMFAPVAENDPAAAFFKINDPIQDFERIQRLVKAGYLVRTRADEATRNARKNDTTRRDKALASGAQFISTDYPEPRSDWSEYRVRLPDGAVARPNPVSSLGGDGDVEKIHR